MKTTLSNAFQKFAGSTVKVEETPDSRGRTKLTISPQDPIYQEIVALAETEGATLNFEGLGLNNRTLGMDPNRVNIHLEEQVDGSWVITDNIRLG